MLAKDGAFYPPQAYCDDVKMGRVTFNGVTNLKKLAAEYGKGATIALTSLDRSWSPLGDLCIRLEEQLDHGVKTNVYITAGRTTGFPPHYDTHDIVVLQIAGAKRWRIYEPTVRLPDASQPCEPQTFRPGPQLAELELQAGDLLYLPRGYGHAAATSKGHSAHVTLGIHVYTWASILRELDPSCVHIEELRESLPPGFAGRAELRPAIREQLQRLAPEHLAGGSLDHAMDSLIRQVNRLRRRKPGRFRADVVVLSAGSTVGIPSKDRYRITRLVDGLNHTVGLTLDLDGDQYSFPPPLESLLNAMCSHGRFRLQDLQVGLQSEAVVDFAGYLQSIGFLTALD